MSGSSQRLSIGLLPQRAATNRTNQQTAERQFNAEQRRIEGLQERRRIREFEARTVAVGARPERVALLQEKLAPPPPPQPTAAAQWRAGMEQRQAAPVQRGASAADVSQGRRALERETARENMQAAAQRREAALAEKRAERPTSFFDRFGGY